MTEKLHVNVTYQPEVGYISAASPRLPKSLHALSLEGLRRAVIVTFLLRWKKADQPVAVILDLDAAARAEVDRGNGDTTTQRNTTQ
jgi:hypothetical protein